MATGLSEREQQCLYLISCGLNNERIGQRIGLSHDTIKTHLRRAYYKLGARDRAHAVRLGFETGLLTAHTTPAQLPPRDLHDISIDSGIDSAKLATALIGLGWTPPRPRT